MKERIIEIYNNDNEYVSEAFGVLRANILFYCQGNNTKIISMVSCNPGDGKTTISINLAIELASTGRKILLVDTDLRKPVAFKALGKETYGGITEYLENDSIELNEIIYKTNINNLYYIPCGSVKQRPSDILLKPKFDSFISGIREPYDLAIIDTPAIFSVIDGAMIASKTDASIIITKYDSTTIDSLIRLKEQLIQAKASVIGVILNNVEKKEYKRYYSAYKYFTKKSRFRKKLRKK